MVAPDVEIEDGRGTILLSSEEGETEGEMQSNTENGYYQLFFFSQTTFPGV